MRAAILLVGVCAAVAVATTVGGGSAAVRPPASGTIALGANLEGRPGSPAELDAYRAVTGRTPAIVMWFQQWSEPFVYGNELDEVRRRGTVPMITWEPSLAGRGIPLRDIAAGRYDGVIERAAATARAYKDLLYVRFAHEMNLRSSLWGAGVNANTPGDFIAAWRHVVQMFRQAGADNVKWVWSPNVTTTGSTPLEKLFPGDDVVDVVGLDGYNFGALRDSGFRALGDIFQPSYDELTRLSSRPVFITETASTELGGSKAPWILDGFMHAIPERLPRVRAVIWFDRRKETDWRVDSSPASAAAFRAVARAPLYAGQAALSPAAPVRQERRLAFLSAAAGLRGGRVLVPLRCRSAGACRASLTLTSLTGSGERFGHGTVRIAPGRRRSVSVALDAGARRDVAAVGSKAVLATARLVRGRAVVRPIVITTTR